MIEPAQQFRDVNLTADPWQVQALGSESRKILLCCSRQVGKSEVAAALVLKTALLEYPALILVLSASERQSTEFFRDKILRQYQALGKPEAITHQTQTSMELANGSRIIALPDNEKTIRVYANVAMIVIDEAARVSDDLYNAVRPMLAVSNGRLIALSTPFGKRGWFYESWEHGAEWERYRVPAAMCPRLSPAFLAEERTALGERWYRQEYDTSFEDAIDAVFAQADIDALLDPDARPLWS